MLSLLWEIIWQIQFQSIQPGQHLLHLFFLSAAICFYCPWSLLWRLNSWLPRYHLSFKYPVHWTIMECFSSSSVCCLPRKGAQWNVFMDLCERGSGGSWGIVQGQICWLQCSFTPKETGEGNLYLGNQSTCKCADQSSPRFHKYICSLCFHWKKAIAGVTKCKKGESDLFFLDTDTLFK